MFLPHPGRLLSRLRSRGTLHFGKGALISAAATVRCTKHGDRISIGDRCTIFPGAMILTNGGDITIGSDCSVHPYSVLYGTGGLTIGNDVRIAAHTVMIPFNHRFDDLDAPIRRQGITRKGIVIEDDVWIGAHVTVLAGAIIRSGCVIGAGAVVRGETEPFGVYAGVPAKLIRLRGTTPAVEELAE